MPIPVSEIFVSYTYLPLSSCESSESSSPMLFIIPVSTLNVRVALSIDLSEYTLYTLETTLVFVDIPTIPSSSTETSALLALPFMVRVTSPLFFSMVISLFASSVFPSDIFFRGSSPAISSYPSRIPSPSVSSFRGSVPSSFSSPSDIPSPSVSSFWTLVPLSFSSLFFTPSRSQSPPGTNSASLKVEFMSICFMEDFAESISLLCFIHVLSTI